MESFLFNKNHPISALSERHSSILGTIGFSELYPQFPCFIAKNLRLMDHMAVHGLADSYDAMLATELEARLAEAVIEKKDITSLKMIPGASRYPKLAPIIKPIGQRYRKVGPQAQQKHGLQMIATAKSPGRNTNASTWADTRVTADKPMQATGPK